MPRPAKSPASRGRPADATSKSGQIRELLKTNLSVAEIAKKVGCTPGLVYNVKSSSGGAKKRGPGRPAKARAGAATQFDGLDGLLAAVKGVEQERAQLRAALEKIQGVLAALS